MERHWFVIPRDFRKRAAWTPLEGQRFEAAAFHLLVCKRNDGALLNGPAVSKVDVPAGSQVTLEQQHARITTETRTLEEELQHTLAEKIGATLALKTSTEAGFSALVPSGKVAAELNGSLAAEVTTQLQERLKTMQSFQVQDSESIKVSTKLKLDGSNPQQESIYFYLNVRPVHWDVYVMEAEYLRILYKREYLIRQVRHIETHLRHPLRLPLCRITLHEPVLQYSIARGTYVPAAADPYAITIGPVNAEAPTPAHTPPEGLAAMLTSAFPLPKDQQRGVTKKRAAQSAAKKAAPKKKTTPSARRARVTKQPAKKPARRLTP